MQSKLVAFADESKVAELAGGQYRGQKVAGRRHDDEELRRRGKVQRWEVEREREEMEEHYMGRGDQLQSSLNIRLSPRKVTRQAASQ